MLGTEPTPASPPPPSSLYPATPCRFRRTAQRTFRWLFSQKQLMLNLLKTFVSSALLLFSLCRCFLRQSFVHKGPDDAARQQIRHKKIRERNKSSRRQCFWTRDLRGGLAAIAMHVRLMGHGVFNSGDYATFTQGKWAKDALHDTPWPPTAAAPLSTARHKAL